MPAENILITGGLGYVGGRLSQSLSQTHSVSISTRSSVTPEIRAAFEKPVEFVEHDNLFRSTTFPKNIDCVIHLAALNELDSAKNVSLANEVNVEQTRKILEASIEAGARSMIFFSTIHVYGNKLGGRDITEKTLTEPAHPYAVTHKAAEDIIMAAHHEGRIKATVIRMSNSFGRPLLSTVNRWTLLVNDICRQAVTTGRIQLNSNGSQYRDFITLTDVVRAVRFLLGLRGNSESIFNLTSEKSMTVLEMASMVSQACSRIFSKDVPVVLPKDAVPSVETRINLLSANLRALGFTPFNKMNEELDALLQFCQLNFGKNA